MLLFPGLHFLAIVEGHERDIARLWLRSQEDERHRDLIRIGDVACGTPWFPRWMISCTANAEADPQIGTLRSPEARVTSRWTQLIHPIMLPASAYTQRRSTWKPQELANHIPPLQIIPGALRLVLIGAYPGLECVRYRTTHSIRVLRRVCHGPLTSTRGSRF